VTGREERGKRRGQEGRDKRAKGRGGERDEPPN